MSEGQKTLSQKHCYLPRNSILLSGFLFPWSETSFPGGSTGWTRHRDADTALAWPCPVTITPSCCLSQQPALKHQPIPGRRTRQEACCVLDLAWVDETKSACSRVGSWEGGGKFGSALLPSNILWNLKPVMQIRWWGQREKNNMKGKLTQRGNGRREVLLKQHSTVDLFTSQQQWVSIKQSALTMLGQSEQG